MDEIEVLQHMLSKGKVIILVYLREDTHKKSCFFSGRATKGVGRVNPPDH